GAMPSETRLDDGELAREAGVVDARTTPGDIVRGGAGEGGDERARRRRVADAHLADADEADTVARELRGELDADVDRGERLVARHRRSVREAGRAGGDATAPDLRQLRQLARDAHVDDDDLRARLTTEHAHRGATGGEVEHHLCRDLARV